MRVFGIAVSILLHLLFGWLLFGPDLFADRLEQKETPPHVEPGAEPDEIVEDVAPMEPPVARPPSTRSDTSPRPNDRQPPAQAPPRARTMSAEERRGYEAGKAAWDRGVPIGGATNGERGEQVPPDCEVVQPQSPGIAAGIRTSMLAGLEEFDRGFVAAQLEAEAAMRSGEAAQCAAADVQPAEPSTPNQSWIDRIRSGKPMSDAEFDELHRVAWDDPVVMQEIATSCVGECDDATVANFSWMAEADRNAWRERAAQFGIGLLDVARAAKQHGDRVAALAWHDYGRWIAINGCMPLATSAMHLEQFGRGAATLRPQLSAGERASAAESARMLARDLGPRALLLWPCPG